MTLVARNQDEVLASWLKGQERRTQSGNFEGHVNGDGSAVLMHYRTMEAVRTKSGLVLANSQCWAAGFAKCTPPSAVELWNHAYNHDTGTYEKTTVRRRKEAAASLPLDLLGSLPGTPSWREIVKVTEHRGEAWRDQCYLVRYSDKTGAFVGMDHNPDDKRTQWFAFKLTAAEMRRCKAPKDALLLLKPKPVLAAEAAGLRVRRQGEWFFVPTEAKPRFVTRRGRVLDNHVPLEWGTVDGPVTVGNRVKKLVPTNETPVDDWAPACLIEVGDLRLRRETRNALFASTEVLVRGTVKHQRQFARWNGRNEPDHSPLPLGRDTWHRAVTHDRPCVTWDGRRGRGAGGGSD